MSTGQNYASGRPGAKQTSQAVNLSQQWFKDEAEKARRELFDLVDGLEDIMAIDATAELILDFTYAFMSDKAGIGPEESFDPYKKTELCQIHLEQLYTSFQLVKFLARLHVAYNRVSDLESKIQP